MQANKHQGTVSQIDLTLTVPRVGLFRSLNGPKKIGRPATPLPSR